MEDTLEAIRFLANSANRVRVLDEMAAEPSTRRQLQEATGVSRSTVSRTLDRCESRGWVASEGSEYWITPLGEEMRASFLGTVERTAGILHLEDAIEWLPPPARAIDFRHLRDAEVVTPEPENPNAPFDHGLERILAAETYRGLTATALPRYVEAIREAVAAGELAFETVKPAGFFERIGDDPARLDPWRDLADLVRIYDGEVPVDLHIADDTVLVWLGGVSDGDLEVYGLLESENPAVLSWAESFYEEYRAETTPLDPDELPRA